MTFDAAKTLLSQLPIDQVREVAAEYVHMQAGTRLAVLHDGKVLPSPEYVIGLASYLKQHRTH